MNVKFGGTRARRARGPPATEGTVTKHWYDETSAKKVVDTWEGTVERD